MSKKILFSFLVSMLTIISLNVHAENNDGPKKGEPLPHLSPSYRSIIVSYDETNNELSVLFRRTVEEAYLYVYKDGSLIGMDWLVGTTPGSTYTYFTEGSGTYTVVLQTEDDTLTLFEETI